MLREIVPGLMGGLITVALGAIAMRTQRGGDTTREGWRRLRPGFMIHVAFFGSLIMVGVVTYFLANGGSARRDAAEQNFYAMLFGAAFLLAAVWSLWSGYLRVMEWSGHVIRVRSPLGEQRVGFSEIVDVSPSSDGSQIRLHLADGRVVGVNLYAHGANELLEALGTFADQQADLAERGAHTPLRHP